MSPSLIAPEVIQRLAGSVLHFIWQGTVIAAIAGAGLRMLRRRSAEARYAFAIGALAWMLVAPLFTVAFYSETGAVAQRLILALNPASPDGQSGATAFQASVWAQRILLAWFIGVLIFATRLVVGWRLSWRLVKSAREILTPGIMEIFAGVRERLGLRRPIRLLAHTRLDSPVVVGWLRPVVLLPVSLISGFTTEQLSAIFAHELAHIRRHDFVVNILQRSVEAILFYHPAVWWLSKRIRAEREHCCDDIAIRLCGSRKIYAEVLIEMERARQPRPLLSVAAADGAVLQRFRRVLGMSTSVVDWQSAVGTLLFLGVLIVVGMWQSSNTIQAGPRVPANATTPAALAILKTETTSAVVAEGVNAIAAILTAQPVAQVPAGAQAQFGVVTGVLRTSTGLPLEGVRIALTPADQSIANSAPERLGLSDSAGRYRLENVSPGRYNIRLGYNITLMRINQESKATTDFRIYHPGVAELAQATTFQVVAGSAIEAPDMMYGGNVAGRVVDMATGKGRRIKNLVLCCDYSQPNSRPTAWTFMPTISDDGRFVFPFVPPANYSLSTADPDVVPISWALAVSANGATGLQLDVSEGVEVQGTVLDQAGKPVSASVQLRPQTADSVFRTISEPMNAPLGAVAASFIIEKLPGQPGIRVLGYPSLDGIRDRILAAAKTRVRSATPGPDGRFAFQKVYPGAYVLEVNSGGIALPAQEIQVGIAGLTNVSFRVPAILLTGRVNAPGGASLPKLNYIRFVRDGSDSDVFYGFPDTEGNFSLPLPPGEYRVFTERLGPKVQSVSDGLRDITNTAFPIEAGRSPQIIVTLGP